MRSRNAVRGVLRPLGAQLHERNARRLSVAHRRIDIQVKVRDHTGHFKKAAVSNPA